MQSYQPTEDLEVIRTTGARLKSRIESTINSMALLYDPGQDVTGPLTELKTAILEIAYYTKAGVWGLSSVIENRISHERSQAIEQLRERMAEIDRVLTGLTDVKPKRKYRRRIRTAISQTTVTDEINWDKVRQAIFRKAYKKYVKRSRAAANAGVAETCC